MAFQCLQLILIRKLLGFNFLVLKISNLKSNQLKKLNKFLFIRCSKISFVMHIPIYVYVGTKIQNFYHENLIKNKAYFILELPASIQYKKHIKKRNTINTLRNICQELFCAHNKQTFQSATTYCLRRGFVDLVLENSLFTISH